ncbi:HK97 family phage prohead protease [Kordiimonas pumila]|uniref:HK97 family phage prohead protease n=1 Tax=Kordiimonas pumila TaxID=2161677 RepID=A0ABV7D434_9PROT|nr:HK97 family phage prohead protease [Kordiimonas pumila]
MTIRTATKQVALPLHVKAGDMPGTFEGYGAVFHNRDRDGDIIAPGAFRESLKGGMPALLWQHDQKAPIGRFNDVREDEKGLFVKGQLAMTGRGAEAYDLLKMGALNGLSIGFVTKEASRDPASATRTITKADLMEVSLVTFPANDMARISAVKSAILNPADSERGFERMLRDNGFSRTRAKAITAKGFKATDLETLEHGEIAEMVHTLKASQIKLEEKALPLLVWLAGAVTAGIVENFAYEFLKDMLSSEKPYITRMPISVLPGQVAKFTMRSRLDQPTISYVVDVLRGKIQDYYFECTIEYVTWSSSGPGLRKLTINHREHGGAKFNDRASVGSYSDQQKWFKNASESELNSAKQQLGGHFGPRGEFTYIGFKGADNPDYKEKEAVKFIIRDGD